ncbi:hypothetical protein CDAR_95761 [Caerostris darwini]|uniref:Uncharacterized protein n=1 Tax=Caerostris darwini TaxID=1538125 RepID=A0AAV4UPW2_9ARAC|nr:hypothetical protein CDAR_95761 [Caerostris darwini]
MLEEGGVLSPSLRSRVKRLLWRRSVNTPPPALGKSPAAFSNDFCTRRFPFYVGEGVKMMEREASREESFEEGVTACE